MQILCIMGPTGTGKSALALHLAKALDGCIINADSRQVYADFPCITAQPSQATQTQCPHALYGFLPSSQAITAGIWLEHAQNAIKKAHAANTMPILVGGTGLYFRTLLDGLTAIPSIDSSVKNAVQQRFQESGLHTIYEELMCHDPMYAARIHHNDTQRVLRALEVYHGTGKTFSWWHSQKPEAPPYQALRIGVGLPLQTLTPLLAQRIDQMLEGDFAKNTLSKDTLGKDTFVNDTLSKKNVCTENALREVAKAYTNCPDTKAPGWSGIGCREALGIQQGTISLKTGKEQWLAQTRAYAKRQWTWFKADPSINWFEPNESEKVLEYVRGNTKNIQ